MAIRSYGLSATALKYIAILAMTIDHITWVFVKTPTYLGQGLHFFGRLTIVTMSFLVVEGYIHTKSFKRYLTRLLLFAIVSQPIFFFYENVNHLNDIKLENILSFNVLFSLSFALASLKVFDSELNGALKFVVIILLCALSYYCDWCFFPIIFALVFYAMRDNKLKKALSFSIVAIFTALFYIIRFSIKYNVNLHTAFCYDAMMLGLLLGILPILLYNGKRGRGGKASKWFFYVYYPLHLLVLGLIKCFI